MRSPSVLGRILTIGNTSILKLIFFADLTVDVSKIETQQANELNSCAHAYGMITNDFFSFLNNDLEEAENMRIVKEQEEEKAMFSVRLVIVNSGVVK